MATEKLTISDPLSEVTRKDRRALLGISVLGIIIGGANIIPIKLTALGIEFGKTDQNFLLFVIFLITLYFLSAFAICAFSDFLSFQIDLRNLSKERETLKKFVKDPYVKEEEEAERRYINRSKKVYLIRGLFEFLFPCVIALYSMFLLLTADIQPTKIYF